MPVPLRITSGSTSTWSARRTGRSGRRSPHGYLTLALIPYFARQLFSLDFATARINYGLNKVRFPSTVPVGSVLHAAATVLDVSPQTDRCVADDALCGAGAGCAQAGLHRETLTFLAAVISRRSTPAEQLALQRVPGGELRHRLMPHQGLVLEAVAGVRRPAHLLVGVDVW